ncbi:MAG: hypothetical protein LBI34_00355 [Puniceicoccales bacterium]|nr:hypothetical protein [Puniceicoccales bacterium]
MSISTQTFPEHVRILGANAEQLALAPPGLAILTGEVATMLAINEARVAAIFVAHPTILDDIRHVIALFAKAAAGGVDDDNLRRKFDCVRNELWPLMLAVQSANTEAAPAAANIPLPTEIVNANLLEMLDREGDQAFAWLISPFGMCTITMVLANFSGISNWLIHAVLEPYGRQIAPPFRGAIGQIFTEIRKFSDLCHRDEQRSTNAQRKLQSIEATMLEVSIFIRAEYDAGNYRHICDDGAWARICAQAAADVARQYVSAGRIASETEASARAAGQFAAGEAARQQMSAPRITRGHEDRAPEGRLSAAERRGQAGAAVNPAQAAATHARPSANGYGQIAASVREMDQAIQTVSQLSAERAAHVQAAERDAHVRACKYQQAAMITGQIAQVVQVITWHGQMINSCLQAIYGADAPSADAATAAIIIADGKSAVIRAEQVAFNEREAAQNIEDLRSKPEKYARDDERKKKFSEQLAANCASAQAEATQAKQPASAARTASTPDAAVIAAAEKSALVGIPRAKRPPQPAHAIVDTVAESACHQQPFAVMFQGLPLVSHRLDEALALLRETQSAEPHSQQELTTTERPIGDKQNRVSLEAGSRQALQELLDEYENETRKIYEVEMHYNEDLIELREQLKLFTRAAWSVEEIIINLGKLFIRIEKYGVMVFPHFMAHKNELATLMADWFANRLDVPNRNSSIQVDIFPMLKQDCGIDIVDRVLRATRFYSLAIEFFGKISRLTELCNETVVLYRNENTQVRYAIQMIFCRLEMACAPIAQLLVERDREALARIPEDIKSCLLLEAFGRTPAKVPEKAVIDALREELGPNGTPTAIFHYLIELGVNARIRFLSCDLNIAKLLSNYYITTIHWQRDVRVDQLIIRDITMRMMISSDSTLNGNLMVAISYFSRICLEHDQAHTGQASGTPNPYDRLRNDRVMYAVYCVKVALDKYSPRIKDIVLNHYTLRVPSSTNLGGTREPGEGRPPNDGVETPMPSLPR